MQRLQDDVPLPHLRGGPPNPAAREALTTWTTFSCSAQAATASRETGPKSTWWPASGDDGVKGGRGEVHQKWLARRAYHETFSEAGTVFPSWMGVPNRCKCGCAEVWYDRVSSVNWWIL